MSIVPPSICHEMMGPDAMILVFWMLSGKESACQCRRHRRYRFSSWVEKISEGGHGNALQYSRLENSMDRGTWWAIVHGVGKSWTWQSMDAKILFYILFYCGLLQDIVYSSLTLLMIHSVCATSHPLILNSPSLPPPCPLPLSNPNSVLWVCESFCFVSMFLCALL